MLDTSDDRMGNLKFKRQEWTDSQKFKETVDRWRCLNGLEPLYSREKEKQEV